MQFTIAALATIFATGALALPAGGPQLPPVQTATVSFANDQTGRNVPIVAPLDGTIIAVAPFIQAASSAYFVAFPQGASCAITRADGTLIAGLNAQSTFADLDGNPAAAVPILLDGVSLRCGF